MTEVITFTVPGEPQGKGRPRAFRAGRGVRMYTPAKTEAYEQAVATAGRQAMAGREPMVGPLAVDLMAVVSVPASWSKKRRAAALEGLELPAKKPDADNVAKAIDFNWEISEKDDLQSRAFIESKGVKVVEATPEMRQQMKDSLKSFYEWYYDFVPGSREIIAEMEQLPR